MFKGNPLKEECEEEPCRSVSPDSGLIQNLKKEMTEITQIKEEPEEQSIKQEDEPLPVSQISVCVKTEDTETRGQETHLQLKTEADTGQSSDTDNDDNWSAPFSCSDAQMENNGAQNNHREPQIRDTSPAQTSNQLPTNKSDSETSESDEETSKSDGDSSENDVPDWVHQCPFCKKRFMRRYHYDNHIRTHTGEKPFSCSICKKAFAADSSLKGHMAVHNEPKNNCPVCNKSFVQKSYLKIHMRIHSGERPYSCSLCEKSFTSPSNYSTHMRAHNEDRRYTCDFCGRAFVRSSNLKQHMLLHTGEKPFSCSVCDEKFIKKRSLLAHMENKHDKYE
ncbi:zinc finger protein 32-like [Periophthalmus magnuspinnatus]|uniref:zinc finger protein 32-like n=1 Tax=Periophthalmus magnuspinnatus TaxID=409849 RepID=UPI00145B7318|nr:zinc finger protein 32-like [Periophthalmus magnuspinnatus]